MSIRGVEHDIASQPSCQRTGHGKPYAGTVVVVVELYELLKDVVSFLCRDANTRILYDKAYGMVIGIDCQRSLLFLLGQLVSRMSLGSLGEFQGITENKRKCAHCRPAVGGKFGADMQIKFINVGPVTIILER